MKLWNTYLNKHFLQYFLKSQLFNTSTGPDVDLFAEVFT